MNVDRQFLVACRRNSYRLQKIILYNVIPVISASFIPFPDAFAQSLDYASFEELFGEPVTTSVTGSPQRVSDVPASMEIISAEEIRRSGARNIPALLRHVTGVDVLTWSNSGADVSVRGYNQVYSARLLVLVNGRQVYADHYGYTPWSALPVELGEIRQIEVVKGPNSALFGFNAVGGVINIITYNPRYDEVRIAGVHAGTQSLVEGSLTTTMKFADKGSVLVSVGGRQNDDFSTPQLPTDQGTRRGDKRASVRLDAHYNLDRNTEFTLSSSYTAADQTDMVAGYFQGFDEMTARSVRATLNADTGIGLIRASAYRNWLDINLFADLFSSQSPLALATPALVLDNQVSVFQLQDVFRIGNDHTMRLSGEYRKNSMTTTPIGGAEVSFTVYSFGGMWHWQIAPSLSFTNAVRIDNLDLARDGIIPAGLGLNDADWNRSIRETSFNSGIVWNPDDTNTLRLTLARGVLLPNLLDLGGYVLSLPEIPDSPFPSGLFATGLPTLDQTTVDNYEVSWDRQFPDTNSRLKLAVFHGETRGIIAEFGATRFDAGIFSAPANIGDSDANGVEMTFKGTIRETWRWGLGYIYETVDDHFKPQFLVDVSRRNYQDTTPRHVVNANLGWSRGPWTIDGYFRYQSASSGIQSFGAVPIGGTDVLVPLSAYATADARVAYQLSDKANLEISGQNLLHGEQKQTSGPNVERRIMAGISLAF